jgi:cytochrome c biogenesis factor
MIDNLNYFLFVMILGFRICVLKWKTMLLFLILIGIGCSFYRDDFSLILVSNYSSALELGAYKIAALWSNYEGSFLLWITGAFFLLSRLTYKLGFHVGELWGFLFVLFMGCTWNPLLKHGLALENGEGLVANLHHSLLLIHPPFLILGYSFLTLPFLGSLIYLTVGQVEMKWFQFGISWAMMFLTIGLSLGSWWAYQELGWGGFWFWDPVEISGLIPWILTIITLHLLKNGTLRSIIVSSIITFFSSLSATFFVRSDFLSSLHMFTNEKIRTIPLVVFIGCLVLHSCILWFRAKMNWRMSNLRGPTAIVESWGLLLAFVIVGNLIIVTWVLQLMVEPSFFVGKLIPLTTGLLYLLISMSWGWGYGLGVVIIYIITTMSTNGTTSFVVPLLFIGGGILLLMVGRVVFYSWNPRMLGHFGAGLFFFLHGITLFFEEKQSISIAGGDSASLETLENEWEIYLMKMEEDQDHEQVFLGLEDGNGKYLGELIPQQTSSSSENDVISNMTLDLSGYLGFVDIEEGVTCSLVYQPLLWLLGISSLLVVVALIWGYFKDKRKRKRNYIL